ncbi:MAG: aldolase [Proteobacteria bacterium]|nr:aldolase [Pseudomonadota bacterium]
MTHLRERIRNGETVLGAFIKSASHHVSEVLGHAGLDFAIVDAEHAPFGIGDIDRVMLGARSANLSCFVRPPDHAPAFINRCLDLGAAGIVAPHVTDAECARRLIAAMKYAEGQRGFSPSTRAGGYGALAASAYRAKADAETSLWCQIEDAFALAHLDAIAKVEGVDCFFLGRADLALSLGVERNDDPKMKSAIAAIADAARRNNIAFGLYIGEASEIPAFLPLGASVFVCGSDQSYLLAQGRANRAALVRALGEKPS